MADPRVVNRVLDYLRASAVKWVHLVARVKGELNAALDACIVMKDGTETCVADTRTRLAACEIVLRAMKKDAGALLADTADKEDAAEQSNLSLARSIVGPPSAAPVQLEPLTLAPEPREVQ